MKFEEIDKIVIEGHRDAVKPDLEQIINKYHDLGYFVEVSAEALWNGSVTYTVVIMKMVDDDNEVTDYRWL